jgi:hypothetical protein
MLEADPEGPIGASARPDRRESGTARRCRRKTPSAIRRSPLKPHLPMPHLPMPHLLRQQVHKARRIVVPGRIVAVRNSPARAGLALSTRLVRNRRAASRNGPAPMPAATCRRGSLAADPSDGQAVRRCIEQQTPGATAETILGVEGYHGLGKLLCPEKSRRPSCPPAADGSSIGRPTTGASRQVRPERNEAADFRGRQHRPGTCGPRDLRPITYFFNPTDHSFSSRVINPDGGQPCRPSEIARAFRDHQAPPGTPRAGPSSASPQTVVLHGRGLARAWSCTGVISRGRRLARAPPCTRAVLHARRLALAWSCAAVAPGAGGTGTGMCHTRRNARRSLAAACRNRCPLRVPGCGAVSSAAAVCGNGCAASRPKTAWHFSGCGNGCAASRPKTAWRFPGRGNVCRRISSENRVALSGMRQWLCRISSETAWRCSGCGNGCAASRPKTAGHFSGCGNGCAASRPKTAGHFSGCDLAIAAAGSEAGVTLRDAHRAISQPGRYCGSRVMAARTSWQLQPHGRSVVAGRIPRVACQG